MMKAKRIAAFVLILFTFPALLSALFFALPASGIEDPEIDGSASAILCHNESGTVIYRKETNVRLPAGPAVRLAAALVFEGIFKGDAGKTVTVHKKVTGLATSTLNPGLKSGEQITVYDLLCAMLIANSDDAVYALAYAAYPEEENPAGKLIEEMNKKAWALGMARTKFTDLIGKDADPVETGSYTCIDDLLTLALEVQRSTLLCEICGTTEHKISTAAAPNREVLL
ncbi:MAG: hypothetical protein J6V24_00460, partial [Clostridia bacterium]|nr:hypothetical protein [Clostridia bacterium]